MFQIELLASCRNYDRESHWRTHLASLTLESMTIQELRTKITKTVIHLEVQKGHFKWTVRHLAQVTKVSRSLVYYHFGKTKKDILINCLDGIAREFYGLTEERRELSKMSLADSLMITHRMYKESPSYATFYQKWRNVQSPIRDKYLEIEDLYDKKLMSFFPRASSAQRRAIQAVFHGLVTAPYVDESAIRAAVQLLKLDELKAGD